MFKSKISGFSLLLFAIMFLSCNPSKTKDKIDIAFEVLDDEAYDIFDLSAQLEVLDSGFIWTEGPLWLPEQNKLIFNDIPANTTYSWSESSGTEVYLKPSGYTKAEDREGEPGANGLLLNPQGHLILCQHGNRQMAKMDAPIEKPASDFKTIVAEYNGKQLSSPNDATFSKAGNLYFTDPPYGLASPDHQQTSFNGVYRFSVNGELSVLDSMLTRPNGIAFSPDEKYLYVANSDPQNAMWVRYNIDDVTGKVNKREEFYNATENAKKEKGLPDGLKINDKGYIFATGPGGVWIFNEAGKAIAKIKTGQATSNCAFGADQNSLFITADDYLMRATFK